MHHFNIGTHRTFRSYVFLPLNAVVLAFASVEFWSSVEIGHKQLSLVAFGSLEAGVDFDS